MKCPFCQEEIAEGAIKCKHCGEVLQRNQYSRITSERSKLIQDYARFKPYYQRVFQEFDEGGGQFQAKWNWAAFLFGFFWYLVRGMWLKGLVMLAVTFAFAGIPAIFFWLYCGIAGNYDYYLLQTKGKQLW